MSMKKFTCLLILLCLLLYGCQTKEETAYTDQNEIAHFFYPSASADGIYHMVTDPQKSIDMEKSDGSKTTRNYMQVYFYDYKSQKDVPLCSKPNCTHQDEDCDAYALSFLREEDMHSNPIAYKNKLYYAYSDLFAPSFSICQSDLDGSNRKVIYSEEGKQLQNAFIYENKVYVSVNLYQPDEQGLLMEQTQDYEFYSIDLEKRTKTDLSTSNKELVNMLSFTDNKIYLASISKEDPSSQHIDILCLDEGEIQTIQEDIDNQSTVLGYKDALYKLDEQTGNLVSCKYGDTEWTKVLHVDEPGDYNFSSLNPYGIYSVKKMNEENPTVYSIDLNTKKTIKDANVILSHGDGYIVEADNQRFELKDIEVN